MMIGAMMSLRADKFCASTSFGLLLMCVMLFLDPARSYDADVDLHFAKSHLRVWPHEGVGAFAVSRKPVLTLSRNVFVRRPEQQPHRTNHIQLSSCRCRWISDAFLSNAMTRCDSGQTPQSKRGQMTMLRNFDLPEAIIFYGLDSMVSRRVDADVDVDSNSDAESKTEVRPGVKRLVEEAGEVGTAVILLSESHTTDEIRSFLAGTDLPTKDTAQRKRNDENCVEIFSSLELPSPGKRHDDDEEVDVDARRVGRGYSPSPGALIDAITSVIVNPKGFGGSSGFGTKQADPPRNPLPQHCVVIVDGRCKRSRARCGAARAAGMRVIYVESEGMGTCDAEDLADGIIASLGNQDDWEIVTLDDLSTPGSFWLNPPNPRDDEGNRVSPDEVVDYFLRARETDDSAPDDSARPIGDSIVAESDMSEDEFSSILADLDTL